jgi:hypothetical protein
VLIFLLDNTVSENGCTWFCIMCENVCVVANIFE